MKEKFIKKDVTSTLKLDNLFTIYSFLFSPLNIQYYKDHPECHEYPYLTAWRAITHYYENASSIPQYSTDWEEYICDIKSRSSSLRGAYPYRGTIEDCRDILDRHGHNGTGFKSMLNHFLMENQTVFGDYRIILECSFWEKRVRYRDHDQGDASLSQQQLGLANQIITQIVIGWKSKQHNQIELLCRIQSDVTWVWRHFD